MTTIAQGLSDTFLSVRLENIRLLKFRGGCWSDHLTIKLFDNQFCWYDLILKIDRLKIAGISISFAIDMVQWIGCSIDTKPVEQRFMTTKNGRRRGCREFSLPYIRSYL